MTQPASLIPEICKTHFDPDCAECSTDEDDLWIHPRDLGSCKSCGCRYERALSFYDDESLCGGCGDEQERLAEEAERNYVAPPREYEKCDSCGATKLFVHHCDLVARLKAFALDCVEHGDMTPSAEIALHSILGLDPR